jgi:uncharacterized protein
VLTRLLDGNVLIALSDTNHVHFDRAERWFAGIGRGLFATCSITQGTILRHLLRQRIVANGREAMQVLSLFLAHPAHRFWSEQPGYEQVDWNGVLGHRQVTDAYLAALARHHSGHVSTLDEGFAALHSDVVELIPN